MSCESSSTDHPSCLHASRRTRSHAAFARAQTLIPGGVNSPARAFGAVGGEPIFFQSGLGQHLSDVALPAVDKLSAIHTGALSRGDVPAGTSLTQAALRWILDHEGASCVIPGARTIEQVDGNLGAARLAPLPSQFHSEVHGVYDALVKPVIEAEKW